MQLFGISLLDFLCASAPLWQEKKEPSSRRAPKLPKVGKLFYQEFLNYCFRFFIRYASG